MGTILVFRTTGRGTWREIFGGIAAFAKTTDWVLQPVDARVARPDFRQLLEFWKPRGAIVDASGGTGYFREADMGMGGLPTVFINAGDDPKTLRTLSVGNDEADIAKAAMGELLRLNPASLVFVEWFRRSGWVDGRRKAAEHIAALHGMRLHIVTPQPGDAADTPRLVERIATAIDGLRRPCGVFAVSDDIGALVLAAVARLGLDLPGDVSVVSVDDDPEVCENCTPTLTSVRPDYRGLGFAAASRLMASFGTASATHGPIRENVPIVGVIRRASTVATMRRDRKVAEALEMIRLHACEGLKASQVAALFGTSARTAEARFKAATGHTIEAEILERRFAAACGYLREGRASVSAIADFCGWNGDIPFRKAFKARFGTTPTRWTRRAGECRLP